MTRPKTIEETYKKLSQREHVLHRPNMYIGEIKKTLEEMWVFENDKMTKRMVEYSPAFLKIFDEVLTNALDHSNRDTTVDKIQVNYDITTGEISVLNNGSGVPVVVHKEHNLYVPELIFGHLLSGSNYDDSQQRIGAGVNGLGVKLGNIYSKRFVVETIDSEKGLKFVQEFSENMEQRSKPKVTKASGKSYTKITFLPDYARFHMSGLENDTTLLINKRVYDCIACTNKTVNVFLNGERIRGKGLVDYSNYFFEKDQVKSYYDTFTQKVGKNELVWEYIVVPSDHFEQVSFVNGNSTYQGGKHVDHIVYQITSKIKTLLETKKKLKDVKPAIIKERFFLFLRSTIINPQFSSQTKEQLTTQVKDFGCRIEVSDKFIDKLWKSPIVEDIIEFCKMKETMDLAKTTDGKKKNKIYVPKLEDALWAGTAKSDQCTLILTEGLSAMTFALWGRSIVGPDRWGVFPLKGKVLNIRDATVSQLMNNEEINNLKQIIGLKQGVDYKDTRDLRYGKVMILTDADCLVGDTPLLLKNNENVIDIKTIDDLTQEWLKIEDDKFTGVLSDYEIWSDKGWTRIKRIIKKKTSKKIYRIVTHTGSIDVTEDHPLLSINKEEIMAKDVKLDDLLLHDFPLFMENKLDITDDLRNLKKKEMNKIASNAKIQYYDYKSKNNLITELISIKNKSYYKLNTPVDISPNEAYVMGFFQTDGNCGIYKWKYNYKQKNRPKAYDINRTSYSWHISNHDIEKLIKSKNILSNLYDLEFKIIEDKTSEKKGYDKHYKLIINGGIKTKHIVEKYRNLFYDNNKLKKIPSCILNAPRNIREQFLQGIYDGDGDRKGFDKNGTRRIDINGKIGTQGLFYLYKSMGYEVSVNNRDDKPNIYTLIFTKGHQQSNPNRIKKIIDLGYTTDYVYDLETENHHFQGGIGQMIVHNCDGSHIKGLLVNLFHYWWPSLLKMDFIQTLRTPIVKAIRGQKVLEFYTEQDYHKWQSTTNTRGYQIKYFKGLGTSKKEDAQETFRKINSLRIDYYHKDQGCDDSIVLAFEKDKNVDKNVKTKASIGDTETKLDTESAEETKVDTEILNMKCSDKRKRWLAQYDRDSYIDTKESRVSYQDLIHKELIHFSIYDNLRSIPSLCDGLKPSQRKIIHYMLKNNINKVIKVAQLSGYVSAETGYHHGEASLQGAIVSMAQDFVGSNNLNLLYPDGNHGCLDPDTEIMMWNGSKKYAKHIKIGDELVGDDGYKRTVLKTTSGEDDMYEINIDDEIFIVNSQHKLTLQYSSHLNIFWRDCDKSWRVTYFDPRRMKGVGKHISTNLSSDKKQSYNKSLLTKEQAYDQMISFIETLNIDKSGIFDIKVCDYLKLNNTDKHHFKSLKNNKCINWNNNNNLPINPYILGSWLGDGNSNGSGITSIDYEIIKKWVIEMGKIDCEIIHDKVSENHDNYHYSICKSGNGKRYCVGSGLVCEGCAFKKSEICEWVSDIHNPILKRVKSQTTGKNNWQKTLIENNLWNNKHIPFEYMYTSKENRLQLLAGFIDTDGYVQFQNKVPRVLISQSKRLRIGLIYELKFLCETLGYACKIYHESKNRQTKNGEDASVLTLCITGDNLHEIPILLNRKKIQPYVLKRNLYISSFTVKSLGVGKYCGWEIDGNNRFLLGNFIITHNSRLLGGKDAASPRYIFTKLSDITPLIYDKRDSALLKYLNDDGIEIEPEWFMPVLPMVLVNGCEGIGTGYSTYIPPYDPKDIIANLLRVLDEKDPLPMKPYFKNFNGVVEETEPGSYITRGKWERLSDTQIKITELPVGCWVTTYKEFLESMIESNTNTKTKSDKKTDKKPTTKRKTFQLKDVQNKTRDENNDICFIVEFRSQNDLDNLIKTGTLEKQLKLTKSFGTNNMYLFSDNLILTKYKDVTDILLDFYDIRLEFYESRKAHLVKILTNELTLLNSKIRFINEYMNGDLDINRKTRDYIISLLEERDYPKLTCDIKNNSENENSKEKSFDYLVRMPLISLSLEKIRELENHRDTKQRELNDLQNKTERDLWRNDLDNILKMLR
jgi:DNA gyrase/topoisomerase IV subunit B